MSVVFRVIRLTAATLCAALAIGLVVFGLTSSHRPYFYLGPLCATTNVQVPGFDMWTGLPQGRIYICNETYIRGDGTTVVGPPPRLVAVPIPDELVGRRAIPLPVGFIGGALISAPLVVGLDLIRGRYGRSARTRGAVRFVAIALVAVLTAGADFLLLVWAFPIGVVALVGEWVMLWRVALRNGASRLHLSMANAVILGIAILVATSAMAFFGTIEGWAIVASATAAALLALVGRRRERDAP